LTVIILDVQPRKWHDSLTVYLAEAVEALKNKGVEVKEEYLQHLSPWVGAY
jgi:hypothetical protein